MILSSLISHLHVSGLADVFVCKPQSPVSKPTQPLADHSNINKASHLQPLDGQPQHAGGQFGRLLEGEVAPVDDEDETVDLQLRIFYHRFQRQQNSPQYVHECVSEKNGTGENVKAPKRRQMWIIINFYPCVTCWPISNKKVSPFVHQRALTSWVLQWKMSHFAYILLLDLKITANILSPDFSSSQTSTSIFQYQLCCKNNQQLFYFSSVFPVTSQSTVRLQIVNDWALLASPAHMVAMKNKKHKSLRH